MMRLKNLIHNRLRPLAGMFALIVCLGASALLSGCGDDAAMTSAPDIGSETEVTEPGSEPMASPYGVLGGGFNDRQTNSKWMID